MILATPEQVEKYLVAYNYCKDDDLQLIQELTGGVSNRTFLIERKEEPFWVLKQAREKLNVEVDWFCSPERIQREALGMQWLERLAPEGAITPLVFEDRTHHLLVMEAVAQPHENWKTMLMRGEIDTNAVDQFARLLSVVHKQSLEQQEELSKIFEDRSYFEDLRLEPYYGYAAEQVPEAREFLRALIENTRNIHEALVHGDYSPKNVLVHQGKLVLLDHEVIHWGDPAFDLGFSLTHFLSKAHHLVSFREHFLQAAARYWKTYSTIIDSTLIQSGLENRAVYHTLACMLARVAGRSKLEYFTTKERERQKKIVIQMMKQPTDSLGVLIHTFAEKLETNVDD